MKAIVAVVEDHKQPDLSLILEELRAGEDSVASAYVTRLLSMSHSTAQAIEAARIVKGLSTARALQSVGAAIIEIAGEHRADSDSAVSEAESLLRKVRDDLPAPDRSPDPADILRRLRLRGPVDAIPIRFAPTMHQLTGGLQPGHFWVIGGFSSVGKSAVAVNITADVLAERGRRVGIISTEMTQEQYMIRLLSLLSDVPQSHIRDRLPGDFGQADRLRKAEAFLERAPVKVFDTVYKLSDIRMQAKRMRETQGLDVLIVDFLQNVSADSGDEFRDARIVAIELQLLGKELDCTVVGFSQVSNEMAKYQQEGGDNNYYSWKGSGAIRDASDMSILLKRDRTRQSPVLDFHFVKNRHGELAVVSTHMDLPTGKITEMDNVEGVE
jgi:replicative DNA helicase